MGFMKPKSNQQPVYSAPQIPVDAPNSDGADTAAKRADAEAARKGRLKLTIPLSSSFSGGSGISIPK